MVKQCGGMSDRDSAPVARAGPAPVPPKLSRPRVGRSWLYRPRLTAMLDAGAQQRVTLVSAGPGWGKTTAVSAWAAVQPFPVAWLTLDRYDNDPQVFARHVVAALRSTATARRLSGEVEALPGTGLSRVRALSRALSRPSAPAVLVLDDVDLIDDPRLIRELNELLGPPWDDLRIVLVSRSEPALALHRLRAAGELGEIRAGDLAFTVEEATELMASLGVGLGPDEVALLVHRTEGWAVGLQLAAAYVSGPQGGSVAGFTGDVRPVDDYLCEEVLARQSPPLRTFLLHTSICEQLCGELADAVTLGSTGQRTLEELEQAGQFIVRLDSRPSWFRYHHLIRDVLQHRLMVEAPATAPVLHRRAAEWYARQDLLIDALGHAVAAQDWAYVGRLVVHAAPLILSRDRRRLVKVLEQIPAAELAGTSELVVCGALLLFHAGDYAGIRERLREAQALLIGRADTDRRPAEIAIRALRGAVNRVDGDMPAMIDDTPGQLAALAQEPLARLPSALQYRAIALNNVGVALLWSGRPDAAERHLSLGRAAAKAADVELVEINALGHHALLEVMCGSVREAERLVAAAEDKARRGGWTDSLQMVPAHHATALIELEHGRPARSERALQVGLRAHRSDPEAAQWKMTLGVAARIAIAQERLPRARAFLEESRRQRYPRARTPLLDRWLLAAESEVDLQEGRPDLVQQRYAAAHATLSLTERNLLVRAALDTRDVAAARALVTEGGSLMSQTVATVESLLLGALVAEAGGRGRYAGELLEKAVTLAAAEGIRRPFLILAGGRLGTLIRRQTVMAGTEAPFVADLLRRIGASGGATVPAGDVEALSDREIEVLRYLPTMLTAAEIGEELGVSVNTIKAHIRAIYRKLGTPRRRQAVARARERGLL